MADYRAIMTLVLQGRSYRDVVAAVGCSHRDVAAARKEAERIATMRFEGGVSPYLEVLDAQRQLFSAELSLAEALCEQQKTVIRLYLALGGGWSSSGRPEDAPPGKP